MSEITQDSLSATEASSTLSQSPMGSSRLSHSPKLATAAIAHSKQGGSYAYADRVSSLNLDYSLSSLKRVDMLLSKLRLELIEAGQSEIEFLRAQANRRLLIVLARYAGEVLAKQWQGKPQWLSRAQLAEISHQEKLSLNMDNFYHCMACLYQPNLSDEPLEFVHGEEDKLFFALEPIGERLFSSIDRLSHYHCAHSGKVASGLYQAVQQRLPMLKTLEQSAQTPVINDTVVAQAVDQRPAQNTSELSSQVAQIAQVAPVAAATTIPTQDNEPLIANKEPVDLSKNSVPQHATVSNPVSLTQRLPKVSAYQSTDPLVPLNRELLKDLKHIHKEQTLGDEDYLKATKVLDIFEGYINSQHRERRQVQLSDKHTIMRQRAVERLTSAAQMGHTAAMLRLAMCLMLGEGIDEDTQAGVAWIQKAADLNDSRAQRLLSKLYYQGIGVDQDLEKGRDWVEEAAKQGHPDALVLVEEWQKAEALTDFYKQDQVTDKRYMILIAVVMVLAIILFIVF